MLVGALLELNKGQLDGRIGHPTLTVRLTGLPSSGPYGGRRCPPTTYVSPLTRMRTRCPDEHAPLAAPIGPVARPRPRDGDRGCRRDDPAGARAAGRERRSVAGYRRGHLANRDRGAAERGDDRAG